MKVKEIPVSLFNQARLTWQSRKKLEAGKEIIPVVVSLASIPSRLGIVHITVRSILDQIVLPEKIVLWLHQDLKSSIPKKLSELTGERFSIQFTSYSSSHRKLVEPLQIYPNKVIITCDDDMMYRKNWLSNLYKAHLENPDCVIGNQTRCITYDGKNELLPYKNWSSGTVTCPNPKAILPIGAGGTLYPPNSLDGQVFDQELFLKLTPKADDLWFKAMSLLKETRSIKSTYPIEEPIPIWGSQKVSLKKTNIEGDKNRTQWLALTHYFKLKF
ncbi:glycosyltransferase family 2 protein [Muricauda sp. CAU 1633]|uniref:glycosyltransferase family A protein n=1 Tax=Allomuricauda sp. CAU 1633 TaxID=2816036 RepID=UPI001A8D3481|nr:glycosyltransferase family A protein [Muricauda sp. CAU 1633]MBO0322023.1 glycosyltransferase family 2 protein [Muricauda sp. CAU 1633]